MYLARYGDVFLKWVKTTHYPEPSRAEWPAPSDPEPLFPKQKGYVPLALRYVYG
jgi:hypothetical protein